MEFPVPGMACVVCSQTLYTVHPAHTGARVYTSCTSLGFRVPKPLAVYYLARYSQGLGQGGPQARGRGGPQEWARGG